MTLCRLNINREDVSQEHICRIGIIPNDECGARCVRYACHVRAEKNMECGHVRETMA